MSSKSPNTAKNVIATYWHAANKYRSKVIGVLLTVPITVTATRIIPPIILARVLNRLKAGDFITHQPWQSFGHDIVIYTLIVLIGGALGWRLVDLFAWRLEAMVERDLARKVFNHLEEQSADFHANNFSGSLVSQTNKFLSSYVRMADTTIYIAYPTLVGLIAISVMLFHQAPLYVLLLDLFALFFLSTALLISRETRRRSSLHASAESKQTGHLADVIGNIMAVKSFAGEEKESKAFEAATEHTRQKLLNVMRATNKQFAYFGTVSNSITAMSFVVAIVSVVSFNANIGIAFLIFNYTAFIVSDLFSLSNNGLKNYNRAIGDASDMTKILMAEADVQDCEDPERSNIHRGIVEFSNVTFMHKGAKEAIFKSLNLRIKSGEKVGLVGHSGSGKTSLTRILLRFSDIQKGSILIDGQNIARITQADLRRSISYVPQEAALFHRTIAENIGYGREGATREEIIAIAKRAHADDFIKNLPNGYDTLVGERGVKLSGGQRQRIAIARAMLKNAPILVLDEATSALDSESEALIQDALWKLMEGRTAIVIAHRLSTIQKMDRILVIDDGKIVEEGSHKDLLYKKGVYAKLWERQSGGFLEE